ncbi:MAG: alpha-glucosidase [Defluviitaleaceae bacterium]|nr:alpha-glucosidase [Defluviitaleaceae bacterium]
MSNNLSMNSKIKDIYNTPLGRDIIDKILLQMGFSNKIITNILVKNLRLKTAAALLKNRTKVEADFFNTLLNLLNQDKFITLPNGKITPQWWKESVFYQIYPRSFCDANADNIGDINGIISKLDYLKSVGIDAIWLSPIYDSPNDDNGYDIRDYYKIMAEMGNMADFDALIAAIKAKNMRLIIDLVVNHTSDEHAWFVDALNNADSPYRDYYFLRKAETVPAVPSVPNNWTSFFSGPAWVFHEKQNVWSLSLFSKKQVDLNWDNENLRADIIKMIRWWLEKGVDGFRLDVINYISKQPNLPNGHAVIGELMGFYGVEHYFYGPKLHERLHEIKTKAFEPYNAFSVGETPGIGIEAAKLLTAEHRQELDMVFLFDHLENPGKTRFDDYKYDLNYLKKYLIKFSEEFPSYCWQSLFYDNHDNPRMVSKVTADKNLQPYLAKLLAVIQLTLRGTPFIYQGQELGLTNQNFTDISQLKDVESINLYNELLQKMDEKAAFARVLAGTRDHARAMMPWEIILAAELDENSTLNFYKQAISIRKRHKALIYGNTEFIHKGKKNYFAYYRWLDEVDGAEGAKFFVECNLSGQPLKIPKNKHNKNSKNILLLANYPSPTKNYMQPYESRVWEIMYSRTT